MIRHPLGNTGLEVSRLSFGASSLGSVFRPVREEDALAAVHTALELGINYFDVAPAYGATLSETLLGKGLAGVPRSSYILSTKVGKWTAPGGYGQDHFDYGNDAIRRSVDDSARRLGVDHIDILYLHDIEYGDRRHTEWALQEGIETLQRLKQEGRISAFGIGMYPPDLWEQVLKTVPIDVGLSHNICCLHDDRLEQLLPIAREKGIGMINASPFASGLLTGRSAPDWHPATPDQRRVFAEAADWCRTEGTDIAKLALQWSASREGIPTTMFSSADPAAVRRNVAWVGEIPDMEMIRAVQNLLTPVKNQTWRY
jgi:L-galactose dehydrogenase